MKTSQNLSEPRPEGNTNSSGLNQCKSRKWCFTLNNYDKDEYEELVNSITSRNSYLYIIGKEVGESGTPHLQGYIEGKNQISFNTLKNINKRLHLEKAKGTQEQNYKYCSKDGDYITNIKIKLSNEERYKEILDKEYQNVIWKPFQQKILDIINSDVDKRKIYWFHEESGNVGKSYILKYIALTYPEKVIIGNGKINDVFNQIRNHIEEGNEPSIILIDVPRDYAESYFNYGGLENIKNGFFFSGKYEGGKCLFNIPHIIVVSNEEPNYRKLSGDRYEVYDVDTLGAE